MVLVGNTVRLCGVFYDWDDKPVDPDKVSLIIYDGNKKRLEELEPSREAPGQYLYDYVVKEKGVFYFEFYGLINGLPSLNRQQLTVGFTAR